VSTTYGEELEDLRPQPIFRDAYGCYWHVTWRKDIRRDVRRDGIMTVLERIGVFHELCAGDLQLDVRQVPFYRKGRLKRVKKFWLVLE
jgi:hypothetical protein